MISFARSILLAALLSAGLVAAWPWDQHCGPTGDEECGPHCDYYGCFRRVAMAPCRCEGCCTDADHARSVEDCRQLAAFDPGLACDTPPAVSFHSLLSETKATPQPHLAHAGSGVGLAAAFGLAAVALAGVVVARSRRGATPDQAPEAPML